MAIMQFRYHKRLAQPDKIVGRVVSPCSQVFPRSAISAVRAHVATGLHPPHVLGVLLISAVDPVQNEGVGLVAVVVVLVVAVGGDDLLKAGLFVNIG